MNRILAFVLIPFIVLLPGCGALNAWQQNGKLDKVDEKLGKVDEVLGDVAEGLTEIRKVQAEAREKADVDKDGVLSGTELLTYGGLLTAGMAELARRKFKAVDGKVEHEREKRKDAEVAMLRELLARQNYVPPAPKA